MPLISLGKVNRLEVLLTMRLAIYVVDQVRFEVTHDNRFADAKRIDDFNRHHPNVVHEFVTAVGAAAALRRAAGETRPRGQGEAAIAEFLQRVDEVTGDRDAPVLFWSGKYPESGEALAAPLSLRLGFGGAGELPLPSENVVGAMKRRRSSPLRERSINVSARHLSMITNGSNPGIGLGIKGPRFAERVGAKCC
jgi:hypothetical protein